VVRAHPEAVVLDIGGSLGALVVHWDASQIDTPIEISRTGRDAERQHQHILERPMPEETFYAAVFSSIAEGSYTLWVAGECRAREVKVTGGEVTELHWET
jgi:hypothetical protein